MVRHGKIYSDSEYDLRFQNYQNTLERVKNLNRNSTGVKYGVTKFADMSPEEFRSVYLTYKKNTPAQVDADAILTPKVDQAPQQFDWRQRNAVTAVKDQGQCGSCWAFSVTENIESVWILAGHTQVLLSPQQIVDCDTNDAGCNGGDPPTAYAYVISAGGLDTEASYPYTAEDGNCAFSSSNVAAKISSWKYATDPNNPDEQTMLNNLYSWSPLSICVDASTWQDYTGGVYPASSCGSSLDHCVQAVGYNLAASTPYWIVRNSWGTSWGESGYIRLQYGQNTCGLTDEATTAVV